MADDEASFCNDESEDIATKGLKACSFNENYGETCKICPPGRFLCTDGEYEQDHELVDDIQRDGNYCDGFFIRISKFNSNSLTRFVLLR